jgi:polysaccharide export outer membrane protein
VSALESVRSLRASSINTWFVVVLAAASGLAAQAVDEYRLGAEDLLAIDALGAPELRQRSWRIDPTGNLRLPLIGAVRAAGRTPAELEAALVESLRRYVIDPKVSVAVEELGSRPVSVLGAVRNPGLQQLRGPRTLAEALSMANGLAPDAGASLLLTRRRDNGPPPIPCELDASGKFYIASIELAPLLDGRSPELNVLVAPHDVLSVPHAEQVYVIGAVEKAGAFPLRGDRPVTVMGALAMAGGLAPYAESREARILRPSPDGGRSETLVDLKAILAGRGSDLPLAREEVLFVPRSGGKAIAAQIGRAALSIGTGAAIWVAAR